MGWTERIDALHLPRVQSAFVVAPDKEAGAPPWGSISHAQGRAQIRQSSCCGEMVREAGKGEKETCPAEMWGITVLGRQH